MKIKVFNKRGNTRVLTADSFAHIAKIAYKFTRWEYI